MKVELAINPTTSAINITDMKPGEFGQILNHGTYSDKLVFCASPGERCAFLLDGSDYWKLSRSLGIRVRLLTPGEAIVVKEE